MLSFKKLSGKTAADAGRICDYPREDRDRENAAAIEDYRSAGGAPSQWMGSGAAALGLAGSVEREAALNLMLGRHPETGRDLVKGAGEKRRYGTDFTFGAPKSVSVVQALASADLAVQIDALHTESIRAATEYIEQEYSLARRGKGGLEREQAGLVVAVYRHGAARGVQEDGKSIIDMHLHSHAVVMNVGQRIDGSWGAIEFGDLYQDKLLLGAAYRAHLAAGLAQLGFQIEADEADSFRIVGFSKELEKEFSHRRGEIEAELERLGMSGGKAAEVAALNTRSAKELTTTTDELEADWQARAARHGLTTEGIEDFRTQQPSAEPRLEDVLTQLTEHESTFDDADLRRVCLVAAGQSGRGIADAIDLEGRLKGQGQLIRLVAPDGRRRYTTREMLDIEKGMAETAKRLADSPAHGINAGAVDAAIEQFALDRGFHLSVEQEAGVRHITGQGALTEIQGDAGAGKTTMLLAARSAWVRQGYTVRGAAVAGKAARKLQNDSGIPSGTLAGLLARLEPSPVTTGKPPREALTEKDIVVIDEAGMVGSRQMARLLAHVEKAGAKLVLIGDTKQIQSVDAGGAFRALQRVTQAGSLTENRRQKTQEMRDVVAHARDGRAGAALKILADHGMVSVQPDRASSIHETIRRWESRGGDLRPNDVLMLANTRASVALMNLAALQNLRAKKFLGPSVRVEVRDRDGKDKGEREFHEQARVIFKKGDRQLGVQNGDLGTVLQVGRGDQGAEITIKTDQGEIVTICPEAADGYAALEHGYAVTVHAAQGSDANHVVALPDGSMASREMTYVTLSRMRQSTDLVFAAPDLDEDEQLLEPTARMVDFAQAIAEREQIDLDDGVLQSFAACREFLNDHAYHMEDRQTDELPGDLQRIKDLAEAMSVSKQKDTTLDYTLTDTHEQEFSNDRPNYQRIDSSSAGVQHQQRAAAVYQSDPEHAQFQESPRPLARLRNLSGIDLVHNQIDRAVLLHKDALNRLDEKPSPDPEVRRPGAGADRDREDERLLKELEPGPLAEVADKISEAQPGADLQAEAGLQQPVVEHELE